MESNRKITEIVEDTKTHFLEGHLLKEEKFAPTTIEKEYLKNNTKQSYKATMFLISFVIIALATTLILTEFMVGRNIAVIVDINSFRTLDVAEIIQNIKDNQKELRTLKLDIESSKSELEIQIELIRTRARNMVSKLNINAIGKNEYNRLVSKINKQRDIDIATLIKNYEALISGTMARINKIENEVKKQQSNLNTKRTDIIETSNQYINTIIDPNTELIAQNEKYRQLINILSNEMIASRTTLDLTQASLDTLENRNENITDLEAQIKELQRQNIQLSNQNNTNLVAQIEELQRQNTKLSNEYKAYISTNTNNTNTVTVVVNKVEEREQVDIIPVENIVYHKALEYLLLQKRDGAGYIISNNNGNIDIFISSSYKVKIGEKIFVFRGGNFLAELEITNNSKPLAKAKIIRSVSNSKIIPFDIVLFSLK